MHEFLRFLAMMGAFTWLMAGIVSVAIVATYSDEIKKSGITRTEVLLGGCLLPVFGWWILFKIHRHDKRQIRRLEEERLDRELQKLDRDWAVDEDRRVDVSSTIYPMMLQCDEPGTRINDDLR